MKFKRKIIAVFLSFLMFNGFFPAVETGGIFSNETSETKITSILKNEMEDAEEPLSVVVWYHNLEESTIEQMVKDRIGFCANDLEADYSSPSKELIDALDKAAAAINVGEAKSIDDLGNAKQAANDYLSLLMKSHMELTASAREQEKQRTDKYIETRRDVCKELHQVQTEAFIKELSLTEDAVKFCSMFAPIMVCSLTPPEIQSMSKLDEVEEICSWNEFAPSGVYSKCFENETQTERSTDAYDLIKDSLGVNDINEILPLSGEGVNIGTYEAGVVYSSANVVPPADANIIGKLDFNSVHLVYANNPPPNYDSHVSWCTVVAAGTNGIAPNAEIYTACCSHDNAHTYTETSLSDFELMLNSTKVVFMPFNWINTATPVYEKIEKYFDETIREGCYSLIVPCGNRTTNYPQPYVNCPANSFNCIAVGGYYINPTNTLYDNRYEDGNFNTKPEVLAPAQVDNTFGTSYSAPAIAGMLALLFEYRPFLAAHPDLVKAILMASSHQKYTNIKYKEGNIGPISELLEDGITDREGAGVPNMYRMISIVAQHTYGYGTLNSSNNFTSHVRFLQPSYEASNINISMAFLQSQATVAQPLATSDNCRMMLWNQNTTQTSNLPKGSAEMIYRSLTSDPNYHLKIDRVSGSASEIRFGYAWSIDNIRFYNVQGEEGIYYLRNYNSKQYLYEDSGLNLQQNSFSTLLNNKWILQYNTANEKYRIKSADGNENGLTFGNLISTSVYKAIGTNASLGYNISLTDNNDGTYSIDRNIGGATYSLGILNQSSSSDAIAVWSMKNSNDTSQKWILDVAAYQRGDANANGVFNSSDANKVLEIAASIGVGNPTSYPNIQLFLGDYNRDGVCNAIDAALILALL